ncbi:hypothetical protein [Lichenibacterium dinghuense]|nr:hypothetical protein [Lichenibacterium sp. 6Y81]
MSRLDEAERRWRLADVEPTKRAIAAALARPSAGAIRHRPPRGPDAGEQP